MRFLRLSELSERQRAEIVARNGVDLSAATRSVRRIIDDVRARGDAALRQYAREFDGYTSGRLTLDPAEIERAGKTVSPEVRKALAFSAKRIRSFHSRQVLRGFEYADACGRYGQRVVPLDRVGVYVPGGTAAYMSSVLMACIPARVAGVREISVCTPGRAGRISEGILAAAQMCGVDEVHPIGGAHSIAAMAYGTESVPKVQKIVGPGGAFVSAAKLLVRNDCEIDFLAGPSEVLIIADSSARPDLLAADMLAQLEHDPLARAVLVSTSNAVLDGAKRILQNSLTKTARRDVVSAAASKGALFILADSLGEALEFANEYAPEHLLVDVERPGRVLPGIRSAGSVFLGSLSSVAFGDYCSGMNHILPTKGTARMRSALAVYDFLKVIPYQQISAGGAAKLSGTVGILARAEGLPAHAAAASMRRTRVIR